MKQQLIEAIHLLADELLNTGKTETAEYFIKAEAGIRSECGGNREGLLDIMDRLQRSGSMIQYANFSEKEEQLWDRVYELTKSWRAAMA